MHEEERLDPEIIIGRRFKAATRQRMKQLRERTPASARRQRSERIAQQLALLPEYQAAKCVLFYSPTRGEVDLSAVEAHARAEGKRLVYPRVVGDSLTLHEVRSPDELSPGAFNILEPIEEAPLVAPSAIELALIPALAIDLHGTRLGWGGGFYDRLLPSLEFAFRCGLIYDFQLIPESPREAHDCPLNAAITEDEIVRFG